jgi:hypothetical protein
LFSSLKKQDLGVHFELGDDAKYLVAGVGTIPFHLESGNSLDFDDVFAYTRSQEEFSFSFGHGG